jgi:FkbM family methyltransferase
LPPRIGQGTRDLELEKAKLLAEKLKSVSILCWSAVRPRFRKSVGKTSVRVVSHAPEARGLVYWTPGWKTALIDRVLASRRGVFLDVGANIGQTLLDYCASQNRHGYLGFEPLVTCADHLHTIIRDNDLADCRVLPAALSDKTSIIKLFRNSEADSCATVVEGLRPTRRDSAELVSTFRFDEIAPQLLEDPVALVKIDVEGGELGVLRGMAGTLSRQKPWIVCEVLRRDPAADPSVYERRMKALESLLGDLGYSIWNLLKTGDARGVQGLNRIESFPLEPWSPENQEMCDYLFAPVTGEGLGRSLDLDRLIAGAGASPAEASAA